MSYGGTEGLRDLGMDLETRGYGDMETRGLRD